MIRSFIAISPLNLASPCTRTVTISCDVAQNSSAGLALSWRNTSLVFAVQNHSLPPSASMNPHGLTRGLFPSTVARQPIGLAFRNSITFCIPIPPRILLDI